MTRSQRWFEHAMRRAGWRPERQVVALATLGFFIALILGALYLSQVAREATINRRLSELLEERDQLERDNEQLRASIAELKAVPRLLQRAQELGFTTAGSGNIEYLVVDDYNPAETNPVIVAQADEEALPEVYDETFVGWLSEQWTAIRRSLGR
jgi:cell division protein FtsB